MKTSAVYKIVNSITSECYVGSAINFLIRFKQHIRDLKFNKHHSKILQASFNIYGSSVFEFYIIEYPLLENLRFRELYWIEQLKPIFNYVRTEEHKSKIGRANTGKKWSENTRIKIVKSLQGNQNTRKVNKWPHKNGYKCDCKECKEKRNLYMRDWKRKKIGSKI